MYEINRKKTKKLNHLMIKLFVGVRRISPAFFSLTETSPKNRANTSVTAVF